MMYLDSQASAVRVLACLTLVTYLPQVCLAKGPPFLTTIEGYVLGITPAVVGCLFLPDLLSPVLLELLLYYRLTGGAVGHAHWYKLPALRAGVLCHAVTSIQNTRHVTRTLCRHRLGGFHIQKEKDRAAAQSSGGVIKVCKVVCFYGTIIMYKLVP